MSVVELIITMLTIIYQFVSFFLLLKLENVLQSFQHYDCKLNICKLWTKWHFRTSSWVLGDLDQHFSPASGINTTNNQLINWENNWQINQYWKWIKPVSSSEGKPDVAPSSNRHKGRTNGKIFKSKFQQADVQWSSVI